MKKFIKKHKWIKVVVILFVILLLLLLAALMFLKLWPAVSDGDNEKHYAEIAVIYHYE